MSRIPYMHKLAVNYRVPDLLKLRKAESHWLKEILDRFGSDAYSAALAFQHGKTLPSKGLIELTRNPEGARLLRKYLATLYAPKAVELYTRHGNIQPIEAMRATTSGAAQSLLSLLRQGKKLSY